MVTQRFWSGPAVIMGSRLRACLSTPPRRPSHSPPPAFPYSPPRGSCFACLPSVSRNPPPATLAPRGSHAAHSAPTKTRSATHHLPSALIVRPGSPSKADTTGSRVTPVKTPLRAYFAPSLTSFLVADEMTHKGKMAPQVLLPAPHGPRRGWPHVVRFRTTASCTSCAAVGLAG